MSQGWDSCEIEGGGYCANCGGRAVDCEGVGNGLGTA